MRDSGKLKGYVWQICHAGLLAAPICLLMQQGKPALRLFMSWSDNNGNNSLAL